jgi:riboflavin synthase
MFTGLVADLGTVAAVDTTPDGVRVAISSSLTGELREGDSVAVNGVCLTATDLHDGAFAADVMHETLRRSALAEVAAGGRVNLELALRAQDRMGGHIVQGHVDGIGRVRSSEPEGDGRRVWIETPREVLRTCVEKGSITVSGVSLTIAELSDDAFAVALVPHTLATTTLGDLGPGDEVNLEADVIGKLVARLLASPGYPSTDAGSG